MPERTTWLGRSITTFLSRYGQILCRGCFLLVLGPWYPLVHFSMHCRAVDGLQPHDAHQAAHPVAARVEPGSR